MVSRRRRRFAATTVTAVALMGVAPAWAAPDPEALVAQVAGGGDFTLVLQDDGTVLSRGRNWFGQLGRGLVADSGTLAPVDLSGVSGEVVQVAAGAISAVALTDEGVVYTWGDNSWAQLGNGSVDGFVDRPEPIDDYRVAAPIRQVSSSNRHVLALGDDGVVYGWGWNDDGQLASEVVGNRADPLPLDLDLPGTVAEVAAGFDYSLALTADGQVYAWGSGELGQLGNGAVDSSATPVAVDLSAVPGTVVEIVAAGDHNFALTDVGELWGWGSNSVGELGIGTYSDPVTVPARVAMPSPVAEVDGGQLHSLAVGEDGVVWAWGFGYQGQLGRGRTEMSNLPVEVDRSEMDGDMIHVGAGWDESLAVGADGTTWAWGKQAKPNLALSLLPVALTRE